MRKLWLFAIFYVLVHKPSGDVMETYEGMPQQTVANLITERGFTFDFISQASYESRKRQEDAAFATRDKAALDAAVKAKADAVKAAQDTTKNVNERIDALIKILDSK